MIFLRLRAARLRYTDSMNVSVVQDPESAPYRRVYPRAGDVALTCSSVIPAFTRSRTLSRTIVTMSRYCTTSS